ncbi:MAG: amidohydrolase family protein [Chloroflexota bacterium]
MSPSINDQTETIVISADSHMAEPPDLWEKNLPARLRDRALKFPNVKLYESHQHLRAGGWDPQERLKDMAFDGISAEVLYPTLGYYSWLAGDEELEEACIRVYNDWMIDFCSVAPERFWGLAIMPLRNIEHSIAELERCKLAGLRGAAIWIAPPPNLDYTSDYYERFWAAAQEMGMPLSMHINARAELRAPNAGGLKWLHSVNGHKFDTMDSLAQLIGSGVMERYPRLQFQAAEVGVGWIPFWLQEFDYYSAARAPLPQDPSVYYQRQVSSAFISDGVGCYLLHDYQVINAMWSNDYPHPASIWPDSAGVIAGDLGHLPANERHEILAGTAARIYNGGKLPSPVVPPSDEVSAGIRAWTEGHEGFGQDSRLNNGPEARRAGVPVRVG